MKLSGHTFFPFTSPLLAGVRRKEGMTVEERVGGPSFGVMGDNDQAILIGTGELRKVGDVAGTCLQSICLSAFPTDPPEIIIEGYDDNWYLSRNEASLVCNAKGNPLPTEFMWST